MDKNFHSNDKKFMQIAINEIARNIKKKDGGPFGCVIVKDDKIIAKTHNKVFRNKDSTAHAEIECIRKACKKLKTIDLSGCIIYSTTEPCPMCFSAIHWAGIKKIVFGANTKDAKQIGFNELMITDEQLKKLGKSKIEIISNCLRKECLQLFIDWKKYNGVLY